MPSSLSTTQLMLRWPDPELRFNSAVNWRLCPRSNARAAPSEVAPPSWRRSRAFPARSPPLWTSALALAESPKWNGEPEMVMPALPAGLKWAACMLYWCRKVVDESVWMRWPPLTPQERFPGLAVNENERFTDELTATSNCSESTVLDDVGNPHSRLPLQSTSPSLPRVTFHSALSPSPASSALPEPAVSCRRASGGGPTWTVSVRESSLASASPTASSETVS